MLAGYASIGTGRALKLGATYYLIKPPDSDEMVAAFERDVSEPAIPLTRATALPRVPREPRLGVRQYVAFQAIFETASIDVRIHPSV